ncbi:MAG: DUF4249 domain-containing protein, partial [Bacteroidetes bacterium]|nr:DUF4249 domain-containing protein [Bacteroidota bacterium]
MTNYIKYSTLLLLLTWLFTACEEVIEIDLNSSNPVLVAEGKILQDSTAYIRLSLTSDYFKVEPSEIITDAQVTLNDGEGNSELLEYIENGTYIGRDILGMAGSNYAISIEKDNMNYKAETTLFAPVEIYDVSFVENTFNRPGSGSEETNYVMEITFSDDPKVDNFYMLKYWNNSEELGNSYTLRYDILAENDTLKISSGMTSFVKGTYRIEVISIDEKTFTYYNQLNDIRG